MEVKDIQANSGNIDLVLQVVDKEEPRSFEKFGKQGRVCNAKVKDETGEVKMTLWNDDIEKVNVGDKIHLKNGWCSEYQGERQLSAGKFGKIEIVEAAAGMEKPGEIMTNDPSILGQGQPDGDEMAEGAAEEVSDEESEQIEEEEFVG